MGKKVKEWSFAAYLRLSRDDGDKSESDSISNQRDLIRYYFEQNPDPHTHVCDEYVDDGWSGTNFSRPAFQRMINDIRDKKINAIIVKDLSRVGRNYIEVGNYIENIFPMLNVRFISISDNIDSYKDPSSADSIIVPFKNLLNDQYARDASNKVRAALDMKRNNGKFIGSFAPYGYMKDPNDHNHLIIDPQSAPIVNDIFQKYLSGMPIITIAKCLNDMGVPNPSAYKKQQGLNYKHPESTNSSELWCDKTIRRILTKQTYIGDMVQGVNKIKSYKIKIAEAVDPDDWKIVKNTHEAIVDPNLFLEVQNILGKNARNPTKLNHPENIFAGLLKCFDCKRAMNRKHNNLSYGVYHYYVCSTYKKMSKDKNNGCSKHSIRLEELEKKVLMAIQFQIDLIVDMAKVVENINGKTAREVNQQHIEEMISKKQERIAKLENMRVELYPDWKSGNISKEEYDMLRSKFTTEIEQLNCEMGNLCKAKEDSKQETVGISLLLKAFVKHKKIDELTRQVLMELVESIYVHENKDITIVFKFQDEFKAISEYVGASIESA